MNKRLSRRGFLKLGMGAAVGATGSGLFLSSRAGSLTPVAQAQTAITPKYYLAGTDGWASLPGQGNSAYYPDLWAPQGKTTYMFGFANATAYRAANPPVSTEVLAFKESAQVCAPMMFFDENEQAVVRLTNLGLAVRPDLVDAHTIHWHGFQNVIPMFDGEPSSSIAVPIGRIFDYSYKPFDPGTYMYHCHFEDTEHVHMGMTGPIVVRPAQNGTSFTHGGKTFTKFAYNDGDGSTGYNREYVLCLTEVWNESHWDDAHIQLPDWTDYKADFYLINGRSYPDTLKENATFSPDGAILSSPAGADVVDTTNPNGPLIAGDLSTQPYSALVKCKEGERVLLRLINLGFTKASLSMSGLRLRVVGLDATIIRGKTDADGSYEASIIQIGPGESVDALFEAPAFSGSGDYDTYLCYNRNLPGISNNGNLGLGGQVTEVRVYPASSNALAAQQVGPNDLDFLA